MHSKAIEALKKNLTLTNQQRGILVGLLLGDGCLETNNQGRTYRLKVEQSARHEAYVRHLYQVFGPWVLSPPKQKLAIAPNGSPTSSWFFNTVSHGALRFYAQQFYPVHKKCVPKLIHRWLTPRGLAYWFMDDGSIKSAQSKGVVFHTHGFACEDVERLVAVLQNKFELQASIRQQKDGMQIYVSGHSYERFVNWIDPYLINEMRYKVPQARRTHLPKE